MFSSADEDESTSPPKTHKKKVCAFFDTEATCNSPDSRPESDTDSPGSLVDFIDDKPIISDEDRSSVDDPQGSDRLYLEQQHNLSRTLYLIANENQVNLERQGFSFTYQSHRQLIKNLNELFFA